MIAPLLFSFALAGAAQPPMTGTPPVAEAPASPEPPAAGAPGGPPEVAPAPPEPPPQPGPPADVEPPAAGGAPAAAGGTMAPLPPPPRSELPRTISRGPWRGRYWWGGRVEVTVPLAGKAPARGEVVSGGGTVEFGVRPLHWLGLRTAMGLSVLNADVDRLVDVYGHEYTVIDYGHLLSFEVLGVRPYLPVKGRVQPYLDVAGGAAVYFPPGADPAKTAGLGRFAVGFEGWVTPKFTLGCDAAYRLLALRDAMGHALQLAGTLGLHW